MIQGGKIIGSGGQACIFSPAFESADAKSYVTKVMSSGSSLSEWSVANELMEFDPKEKYGVYVRGLRDCDITRKKLLDEGLDVSNDKKCKEIGKTVQSEPHSYCAITIPLYKHDLETIPNMAQKTILKNILGLWRGLIFYHDHFIVHGDIKAPNIALYKNRFVFADWGWAANIATNSEATVLITKMRQFPDYTPKKYGGESNGIWAPLIFDRSLNTTRLLFFNDIFMLAYFTEDLLNEVAPRSHESMKKVIKSILTNQLKFYKYSTAEIYKLIWQSSKSS